MKLAISTYSFQRLLQSGSMTQLDCVAETARMGADAIEFVDILPHDGSSRREYAEKLRESCREHGLEIACYTVAADFIKKLPGYSRKWILPLCWALPECAMTQAGTPAPIAFLKRPCRFWQKAAAG